MSAQENTPSRFAGFQDAVEFLEGIINYEKRVGWKYGDATFDLRRMRELLAQMGNPHQGLAVVHVAGTKGKGSTAALTASTLTAAGYRTGLHTSPHLVSVCERMQIDGEPIAEEGFCRLLEEVRDYVHRRRLECRNDAPTYFDLTSALALLHFRRCNADWAVVEVGLGGRIDSTNVVQPLCCVITPIGFDHMDKLGDTIERIAAEKAGILKPGVPVVIARQRYAEALPVIARRAEELACPRWEVGREVRITRTEPLRAPLEDPGAAVGWKFDVCTPLREHKGLHTSLLGSHQVENCAAAIGAVDMLQDRGQLEIGPEAVAAGIAACRWPARVELLRRRPALVLDAAHTPESVEALLEALETHLPGRPVHFVFGCSSDKDCARLLGLIAPACASLTATQARSPRARPASEIGQIARSLGIRTVRCVEDAAKAVHAALRNAAVGDVVCVTGSFFVAGEVRDSLPARLR